MEGQEETVNVIYRQEWHQFEDKGAVKAVEIIISWMRSQ